MKTRKLCSVNRLDDEGQAGPGGFRLHSERFLRWIVAVAAPSSLDASSCHVEKQKSASSEIFLTVWIPQMLKKSVPKYSGTP